MIRAFAVLALALLAVPATLPAQNQSDDEWLDNCRDDWGGNGWRSRARHCEIRETGLKATGGTLTVAPGMNGGVEVVGWDADSIAITARIQVTARSAEDAAAIARDIRIEASGASVRATGPRSLGRNQHWGVMFVVLVPRRSDLALATNNGPLCVTDVTGRMDLSSENGPLTLSGVGGDVRARVDNGPLLVELAGNRWEGVGLDAETVNGPAILDLPERYNAKVEFGTVNGPMDVDFPITVTLSGKIRNRISTTLGDGGPLVRVVTTNGPMKLRRS